MILVGTSGFQYREWTTVFYPKALEQGSWLNFYRRHFGCCEIGFTCYRIPEASVFQEFVEQTGGSTQFVFRVPWHLLGRTANDDLARRFCIALSPLRESGQLAGAVAQFPEDFGFFRENFDRLCALRDSLNGIQVIAEFGCSDWLSARAARHLASARIGLACVDGGSVPKEKKFFCATAETSYVRFQGRNNSRWTKEDGSAQHDYLYSRAELAAVVPEIRRLEQESGRVLVFMNNPWRGRAIINARMLIGELRITNDK